MNTWLRIYVRPTMKYVINQRMVHNKQQKQTTVYKIAHKVLILRGHSFMLTIGMK